MVTKVSLEPEARRDIASAIDWYEQRSAAAPLKFSRELRVLFKRISENPFQFPIIHDPYRRALLQSFPWQVIFYLREDHVYVLAVSHCHRRPAHWLERLDD